MLVYFTHNHGIVNLYGGISSSSGQHTDFSISVRKGEAFGGISYDKFADEDQGTVLWDETSKTGEILKPDDPRWDTLSIQPQKNVPL